MALNLNSVQQERIQRLKNAGILTGTVSDDLLLRLASMTDDEITHFISAKAQVGDVDPSDQSGFMPF